MHDIDFPKPEEIAAALDPRALYLMVLPTENCNFRCAYCYEGHEPGRMAPETVAGIKRLIDRRMEDLLYLRLSWFGGEPLLAKDIVFDLCEHAQRRCREKKVELLPGDMVTNAYFLTLPVAERLVRAGHRHFHISLDGFGPVHDRTRPLASGKGTFDRIWRNLTALRDGKLDFEVVLRLHYGAAELHETEEICRKVNEHFGGDHRFRVLLQRIANLGGINGGNIVPMPIKDAKRVARHLAALLPDVGSLDPEAVENEICYAAQPNHLMIRTDGRLSKCAVNLSDARNMVGRLHADGRLQIDGERFQMWLQGFRDLNGGILACPYRAVRREAKSVAAPH